MLRIGSSRCRGLTSVSPPGGGLLSNFVEMQQRSVRLLSRAEASARQSQTAEKLLPTVRRMGEEWGELYRRYWAVISSSRSPTS